MVELLAINGVRSYTLGDQRLCLDRAAWRADLHQFGIVYAYLCSVFRADFHEQLRLQLGQPGQPATHTAAEVMLGETVGREDVRILLRTHCCEHLLRLPDFCQGVRLLLVNE